MRSTLLLVLLLSGFSARAQTHATLLPANPDYTALVNDHLAGPGVTVLGAGYQYFPYGIGTFNDTIGSIGMNAGLVMATGVVMLVEPPNLSQGTTMGGQTSGLMDVDLMQLLNPPAPQWDAAILTIELIPAGDSLKLRYVFGSEEYDEYVCSIKNDIMGISSSDDDDAPPPPPKKKPAPVKKAA
ncbi:MAG TPA: choice-of-anchor L domain-containing protein, partial [Flavobacteriales bacterium]|nr:choice-of-anchor L domain-containing protein [Flavobacteriales bacterium]